MQGDILDAGDGIVTAPLVTRPVGAGHAEPMQHREKNGALHIKGKLPAGRQITENRRQAKLPPEPLEDHNACASTSPLPERTSRGFSANLARDLMSVSTPPLA
jgi:hypothetical protein